MPGVRLLFCFPLVVCGMADALSGQSLERAVAVSRQLSEAPKPADGTFWDGLKAILERSQTLHAALRDWAESLLPKSRATLDAELPHYKLTLDAELRRAELPASIDVSRPKEDPDKVVVQIGVEVPCGVAESVYVYDYASGSPRRILESSPLTQEHGETLSSIEFSAPDRLGVRSILVARYGVQCGSSWNRLSYEWYRIATGADRAVLALKDKHGIWFGGDPPYEVRLSGDELLMEIRDRSIDTDVHNRAHVLHYRATNGGAERIDPVALQPQDFVDEWLSRPWSEMESRSASGGKKLREWQEFITGGTYLFVQPCEDKSDTQIGLSAFAEKAPEPIPVFFLVHQLEQYRFEMKAVSFDRQEGCPGESEALLHGPTLFPKR
jgi:hypothetical protein